MSVHGGGLTAVGEVHLACTFTIGSRRPVLKAAPVAVQVTSLCLSRRLLKLGVEHERLAAAGWPVASDGGTRLLRGDRLGAEVQHALADCAGQLAVQAKRLVNRVLVLRTRRRRIGQQPRAFVDQADRGVEITARSGFHLLARDVANRLVWAHDPSFERSCWPWFCSWPIAISMAVNCCWSAWRRWSSRSVVERT